jgi:hypothetical protein
MSFIDKLFGSFFQKNNKKPAQAEIDADEYIARAEKERQERIRSAELRLKDWIVALIAEKGSLQFSWESGNDEAFVTFKDWSEPEADTFQDLEEFIVDKLGIPDAGEFEMTGSGMIYLDGNMVKAKYSSAMKAIIDYDEKTDQVVYSEEEEKDNGDEVLFFL